MIDGSPYDFDLPDDRIARHPAARRDDSRLLEVDPAKARIVDHDSFRLLPGLIAAGDLLVVNETRVFKARLRGRRASGGRVEALLLGAAGPRVAALVRPLTRLRIGEEIHFRSATARLVEKLADGPAILDFGETDPAAVAVEEGEPPLPPYLKRDAVPEDVERYQTVYADAGASVAAPTAGLHFTGELLDRLSARGVAVARLRLDVGYGTFAPIKPGQDRLHLEEYCIPEETLAAIERTRSAGGRVVAVGTTVVRTLEAYALSGRTEDRTDLFIRPGHVFRLVDAMVTNFHLPGSSLLMLVHAFAGEIIFRAYAHAIENGYRFFSYGDAMFISSRLSSPSPSAQ
jgi:S-adenosylmethionine:tRNA ribosyltransferase-isomerase